MLYLFIGVATMAALSAAIFFIRKGAKDELKKEIAEEQNENLKNVIGLDDAALSKQLRDRAKRKNKD